MKTQPNTTRFAGNLLGKTLLTAIVGGVLFVNHHLYPFIPNLTQPDGQLVWLVAGSLSCLAIFYGGNYIYWTAWTALKFNETNKNTLIALGTLVLLIYSMLRVLFPDKIAPLFIENYFVSAVLIIALANLATLLERRAKRGNASLLHRLRELLPAQATLIDTAGVQSVALAQLQAGDVVEAAIGDVFVADGVIIDGETKVDQAQLNGDPIPFTKNCGDEVFAGSLNKTAKVRYRVNYVGKQTILAHMINMVTAAQSSKTRSSRLLEIFTTIFIPFVLLFAVIALLLWYNLGPAPHYVHAMIRAVTILIVASPTALAISIPIPILMGIGKAAQYGILLRNAQTLIKTAKINAVVFDKSGILTQGKPYLTHLHAQPNSEPDILLQYAASVENRYEHPIANAIVDAAKHRNIELLPIENFTVVPGQGISGTLNQQQICVGNPLFMQQQGIAIDRLNKRIRRTTQQGYTVLLVAVDAQLIGLLALQDDLRKDTHDAILRLNKLGIESIMFTADNQATAINLGRKLGIKRVFANISAAGKIKEIERLQQQGKMVALVAAGTSDALALARADVSIAVATHSHLMLDTANINLMRYSLHGVADTIRIARATRNKIRQNLSISLIYNLLAILFAAGVYYPIWHWLLKPTEAMILMTICTLSIVLNANRLLHFKPFQKSRKK